MTSNEVFSGPDAPIQAFMARTVARVSPDATLAEVAEKLSAVEVGALVVSSGTDEVDGVISERDVVRAVGTGKDPTSVLAGAVASRELTWCGLEDTISSVTEKMMANYVRHVLVSDHGRLVGIVSARDVLGAYLR